MKHRRLVLLMAAFIVLAGLASAQTHYRARSVGVAPSGPASVISGVVVSFTASAGHGMPTLVVRQASADVTLVLGPFWFLQEGKFAATAGDVVDVNVLGCSACASGYAVVSVKNLTNGTAITLRNADGLVLWSSAARSGFGNGAGSPGNGNGPGSGPAPGFGPGSGYGPGAGSGRGPGFGSGQHLCGETPALDMTKVATVTGTIKSFTGGIGTGRPTLTLTTANGDSTFLVSPFRIAYDAGFEFVTGAALTVTAAPNANGDLLVITITDHATGAVLVLRDENGLPIRRF